jgi:ADP-heptose:LPS heptosyltransferase
VDTPKSPVRGKYSIRNPGINFLFRAMDAFLRLFVLSRKGQATPAAPKRILISDIVHLGDVIMATALLPVLKSAYPQARIGFLVGSWSQSIVENHPLVDEVHILDHWMHNRAAISKRKKILHYLRTRQKALRQIRAARYDVAFDLYWNFPNTLPLLWQAKIPMRVGYESGGFGPLATHALEFGDKRLHAAQRFLDLLKRLPRIKTVLEGADLQLHPILPSLSEQDLVSEQDPGIAAFEVEMRTAGLWGKDYLVCHVGAADSFRDWTSSRWRELAELLIAQGYPLLFTGSGPKDEARIHEIQDGLSGCVNLCGRLPWSGFVAAIAGARLLICVDTVAGHIAAATKTPCAVITAGRWPYLWRPLGPKTRVLMHSVPCAPCHRNSGCAGMECIQEVSVAAVYQESQVLLTSRAEVT